MAGSSLTVTSMSNPYNLETKNNMIVLDWVSDDAAGNLDADIQAYFSTGYENITGHIVAIETIPGQNGDKTTDCPTNGYDITLEDPYGYDLAEGSLNDRSNSVAEVYQPQVPLVVDSELTVKITNAGNSKKGRIIIFVYRLK
jgi:hypothetical protein